jgi:putative membrane protein
MKKISLFFGIIIAVFSLGACGNASHNDTVEQAKDVNEIKDSSDATMAMDEDDANFMVDAANAGMMEVELGTIAQQKAMDASVKNFGAMMVRDHSKANDELKALAARKNVSLPPAMGEDMMKKVNELRDETKEFDKKYMNLMVSDHKDVIDKFEKRAENAKDADLKTWSSTTLMSLRMHLDSAKYIDDMIKDKKNP